MVSSLSRVVSASVYFKSILAGVIELINRASARGLFHTLSKFNNRVSDEPISVMIREHREIVRVLNQGGVRPLTKWIKVARRFILQRLREFLSELSLAQGFLPVFHER